MTSFSTEIWVLIGLIAVAAGLSILHTLASYYASSTRVFDLRRRVSELKRIYSQRLAQMTGDGEGESDVEEIVEAHPPHADAAKKAA